MDRRLMLTLMLVTVATLALPASALAAKGGKPQQVVTAAASCSVTGTAVSAVDLPAGELINFMVTPAGGARYGWVLGFTDSGAWDVTVPARTGDTTYEFVSRTWGPNGSKYTVFATCTSGV